MSFGSSFDGAFERGPRLGRDGALVGADDRLAEVALRRRVAAEKPDDIAEGHGRVLVLAEPHIDRRQHLPAADVVGIGGKMRLDPRQQHRHVLLVRRGREPRGERRVGQLGRAEGDVEAKREDRYADDRRRGGHPARRLAPAERAGRLPRGVGPNQAPGDLGPRRLGLGRRHHAAVEVALHLVELVAIDRDFLLGHAARSGAAAIERHEHGQGNRGGQHRHGDPEGHGLHITPAGRAPPTCPGSKARVLGPSVRSPSARIRLPDGRPWRGR